MKILKKLGKKAAGMFAFAILSIFVVHIVQVVYAVTAEPGTDGDPLITKSYVDQVINPINTRITSLESLNTQELKAQLTAQDLKIKELASKLEDISKSKEADVKKLSEIEKYGKFVPVELAKGQTLITGDSGEIILRGGKATAIGGAGGGLSDITSGTGADVNSGQNVPLNHLLLISRDDGRGLKVVSDKAWVLVKGPYTIN